MEGGNFTIRQKSWRIRCAGNPYSLGANNPYTLSQASQFDKDTLHKKKGVLRDRESDHSERFPGRSIPEQRGGVCLPLRYVWKG